MNATRSPIHRFTDVAVLLTISSCLAWPSVRVLFNYQIRGWKNEFSIPRVWITSIWCNNSEINIICTIKSRVRYVQATPYARLWYTQFYCNFIPFARQKEMKKKIQEEESSLIFSTPSIEANLIGRPVPITICPRYIVIMAKVRIKGSGIRDGWESEARRGAKTAFNFRGLRVLHTNRRELI